MKFFRLDLLTLLISLFILNSCKNQDMVGLGVNTPAQINGTLITLADTSIVINTVREDSVITYSSSGSLLKNPLAYFTDPIFGVTVSNLATDINLPGNTTYTLPSGVITIDSALLVLKLADGFYGDSLTSNYAVNVYQLQSKFNTATNYYSTSNFGYSGPLLGSRTFNGVRPKAPVIITDIVAGAPDTLKKVPAQLRIPIKPSFITANLLNASSTTLSSNAIFQNIVKGLYITLDQTKTTGPGGTLMIAPSDSIAVYYKANNGGVIDTAVIYLPVSNFAASIHHTYTTTIQAELNNTTTSRNTFYLQGLAGLRAKVSFPNFLTKLRAGLLKKDSDIVINRAELVVTPNIGNSVPFIAPTDNPYSPVPKLTMYRLDIAHRRAQIEDATGDPRAFGAASFGGFYNPLIKQYHFLLTAYLQDQLLNRTIDYGTYIAPIDAADIDFGVQAAPKLTSVAARTVAVGTDKTSPLSQYQIRLNVIYTRVSVK